MKYDIFLAGPWEKFAPFPYKKLIKEAFPCANIYDPENIPSQKNEDWFPPNYWAIKNSKTMVAFVPDFPFPGVGPETGFFYMSHCDENKLVPLEQLIIIWPSFVKPTGKSVARKMGYIVEDTDQAIVRLRPILEM